MRRDLTLRLASALATTYGDRQHRCLKIVRSYLEGEVAALFEQPSVANLPPDRGCSERLGG